MTQFLWIVFGVLLAVPSSYAAGEVSPEEFDSLGGNRALLDRVKALNPELGEQVVQNRFVERQSRFELAPEWNANFGGDTYVRTQNMGLNIYYHINNRFSVGAKYNHSFNRLTPEGEAMAQAAYIEYLKDPSSPQGVLPDMDYSKNQQLISVQWYPIYGKLSWLGQSTTQFDVYTTAGVGTIGLKSGDTQMTMLGGGLGLWLSPKMTLRSELAWQNYEAKYLQSTKTLDAAQLSLQLGWLL